jgi:hypothetical protein
MRALTAPEMLEVWERGLTQSPLHRSLMLISAAEAEPVEVVARLSAGERDARLLRLREWAFGPQLAAVACCPGCGERLEMDFRALDVRVEAEAERAESWLLDVAGYELRCRAPNSLDLIAISALRDVVDARRQLLGRCLSDITYEGAPVAVEQLPDEVIAAVVARIAQADPQADVRLALSCPQCEHHWQAAFDIGPFFWSEIQVWAQRLLLEVHTLASAYGWREMDILMMSPWRRQFYLSCIGESVPRH